MAADTRGRYRPPLWQAARAGRGSLARPGLPRRLAVPALRPGSRADGPLGIVGSARGAERLPNRYLLRQGE